MVNVALSNGIKKLLHVSSIAASGGKPEEMITESTKWEKNEWTTHYGITKMLAEREVWRGIQEGLDAVMVNPGIILGSSNNEQKATMRIFKQISAGKMPFYTNGTNGFIDVEDVARICIQLMNKDIHGERFILINEHLSFKDYFERIAKQLNVVPPKWHKLPDGFKSPLLMVPLEKVLLPVIVNVYEFKSSVPLVSVKALTFRF